MTVLIGLLGAVQFLTRVPVRTSRGTTRAEIVGWFPVVGAAVGAAVAGVALGTDELIAPFPAAALAVVVGAAITGAFHEDGLADTADAVAGGTTPERRREILTDSRLGTYGTVAVVASFAIRISAVTTLLDVGWRATLAALIAVHAIARAGAVVPIPYVAPPSTPTAVTADEAVAGLGRSFRTDVGRARAGVTFAVAVVIGVVAAGWWAAPIALAALVAAAVVGRMARRSFGGLSGDHLGTIEQVTELAGLLIVAGLATRHAPWWS